MARNISNHILSIFRAISIFTLAVACIGCSRNARHAADDGSLYDRAASYWSDVDPDIIPADSLEQKIVDYLYLVGHLDMAGRDSIWPDFFRHVHDQPNRTVVDYLGESDSPLYSPALLDEYLECLMRYSGNETVRLRTEYLLDNIRKNCEGERISNLTLLIDGKETDLHRLIHKSKGDCLIIFYDPDCDSCKDSFERLRQSDTSGLRIIAVSISDEKGAVGGNWVSAQIADADQFESRFYAPSMPSAYIVSDEGIIIEKGIKL